MPKEPIMLEGGPLDGALATIDVNEMVYRRTRLIGESLARHMAAILAFADGNGPEFIDVRIDRCDAERLAYERTGERTPDGLPIFRHAYI